MCEVDGKTFRETVQGRGEGVLDDTGWVRSRTVWKNPDGSEFARIDWACPDDPQERYFIT